MKSKVTAYIDKFVIKGFHRNFSGKLIVNVEVHAYRLFENGKTKYTKSKDSMTALDSFTVYNGDKEEIKKLSDMTGE